MSNEDSSEKITIDMSDETYFTLLRLYVEENLSKESTSIYYDYLDAGETVVQATSRAIVNEMVIRTLIDEMEREQFNATLNNNNKEENNDNDKNSR